MDGGWEPDWGAMRHESHKHKGNMLKETNDPNQEGYYDPNVEAKRDELIGKVNSYVKQIAAMVDQYRNEFGDEFIDDDDYLRDLDGFVSRLLFGY